MLTPVDALYAAALAAGAPILALSRKPRRPWLPRLLGRVPTDLPSGTPRVWFHGVSVGEVHLLRQLVAGFRRRHPGWQCLISATTATGFAEATKAFSGLPVIDWPFDFSWAVGRALDVVRPDLLVLAEGELWPNLLAAARRRSVPVVVVNARMSPRSFRRYRLLGPLARGLVGGVTHFAAQSAEYADNLRRLGVPGDRLTVTGNVKFDGVVGDRDNPRTADLRESFGIRAGDLVWVCGSTQHPEEELAVDAFRRLRTTFPSLRLVLVPRSPERFESVAEMIYRRSERFSRRTSPGGPPQPIVLVDTMGELGAVWGLADVAFVGGSLDGKRGGQNMIEPAAYGAAVLFGPHTWNFRDAVGRLLSAGGAERVPDARSLEGVVSRLLADRSHREAMGAAARQLVREQQGATDRTLDVLDRFVGRVPVARAS